MLGAHNTGMLDVRRRRTPKRPRPPALGARYAGRRAQPCRRLGGCRDGRGARAPVGGRRRCVRGVEALNVRGGVAAAGALPHGLARKQVRIARRAAVQARGRAARRAGLLLRAG